jgi:dTDP-4-dehydrorhamnose reductase
MSSAELDRPARRPVDSRLRNFHMEISIGDAMAPWEDALTEYLERS